MPYELRARFDYLRNGSIRVFRYDTGRKVFFDHDDILPGMVVHWFYPGSDYIFAAEIDNDKNAFIPDNALLQNEDFHGYVYAEIEGEGEDPGSAATIFNLTVEVVDRPSLMEPLG